MEKRTWKFPKITLTGIILGILVAAQTYTSYELYKAQESIALLQYEDYFNKTTMLEMAKILEEGLKQIPQTLPKPNGQDIIVKPKSTVKTWDI